MLTPEKEEESVSISYKVTKEATLSVLFIIISMKNETRKISLS
jgi:hypothetical protein